MLKHVVPFFQPPPVPPEPVDQPGTLTVTGTRISGRNPWRVEVTITDPDGIGGDALSASITSSDGRMNTIALTRQDANTFTGANNFRAGRWSLGSVSVSYTDGNRVTSTLTQNYSIS